jgi:GNAT superfamily N-acetyltransferase
MSSVQVRPFRRDDREQVTALVNAHIEAVVPGLSVSVNVVMSQLEREPGEFIVDPWVTARATLVAEQRARIVAAAHLLRYGDGEHVSESYRDSGEIRWLLCWPQASYWPDAAEAGDALAAACLEQLERWGVGRRYADGSLPAPGVYGVPEQWPHVRAIYQRAGFRYEGHTEIVFVAAVGDLPAPGPAPVPGLSVSRSVGVNGTRLAAVLGDEVLGFIEVDTDLADAGRLSRLAGWADIGNLHVGEAHRRKGVGTWLVGHAAEWLRLGRVERLLDYAWPEQQECIAFLRSAGFAELTHTQRGWVRAS